jgi:hypothetical protein
MAAKMAKAYGERLNIFFDILLDFPGEYSTSFLSLLSPSSVLLPPFLFSFLTFLLPLLPPLAGTNKETELDLNVQDPANGFTALHYLGLQLLGQQLPTLSMQFFTQPFLRMLHRKSHFLYSLQPHVPSCPSPLSNLLLLVGSDTKIPNNAGVTFEDIVPSWSSYVENAKFFNKWVK